MSATSSPSFADLGLEARVCRALRKLSMSEPTQVQRQAIPEILQGKDVVCRAPTGSGKTLAYILPAVHHLITVKQTYGSNRKVNVRCLVLVPTKDLCEQVKNVTAELLAKCGTPLPVAALTSALNEKAASSLFNGSLASPSILIATPGRLAKALSETSPGLGLGLEASLEILVLDEADLLISYGYEKDLRKIAPFVSRKVHTCLFAATISPDIDTIKELILKNAVLVDVGKEPKTGGDDSKVPANALPQKTSLIKHSFVLCGNGDDKLVHMLAILRLGLVERKVLIFAAGIDSCYRIRLFLEAFGIKSAVVHNQLPIQSRQHIVASFNAALIDYLIAAVADQEAQQLPSKKTTSVKKPKRLEEDASKVADPEFGVTRGIDFRDVRTVINYDVPATGENYVHRAGRTGRSGKKGHCLTIVSSFQNPEFQSIQEQLLAEKKTDSSETKHNSSTAIKLEPFDAINKSIVDSLRYRAEDIARGISRRAVRDARAKELRLELLNSEKLKSLWAERPLELEFLKHDKPLSRRAAPVHLKQVPSYLQHPDLVAVDKQVNPPNKNKKKRKLRSLLKSAKAQQADPLKTLALSSDAGGDGSHHQPSHATPDPSGKTSMSALWASKRRKLAYKAKKNSEGKRGKK